MAATRHSLWAVGTALGGGALAWGVWRMLTSQQQAADAIALQLKLAQNTRIPWAVRQWAEPVARAAVEYAPAEIGPERWAYTHLGLVERESGGDAQAHGDGGKAHGLGQIHERYWPAFAALSELQRHDPLTNLRFSAKILRGEYDYWLKRLGGFVLPLAAASYNAGRANVDRALRAGLSPDAYTTGGDYGGDVLARADRMAQGSVSDALV